MAGLAFMVLTGMYFLPTILAAARGNRSTFGIGLLNFFAGWTFVGWIVALIWALTGDRNDQHVVYVSQNVHMPPYPPYGGQHWQPQSYIPPQQAQHIDRGGPPMNVWRRPSRP